MSESASDRTRVRKAREALARLRRESRWYILRVVGSMGCAMLAFVSCVMAAHTASLRAPNVGLLLCCLLCMIVGGLLIPYGDGKSLAILAEAPDVTMIGPLLEALDAAPEPRARKIQALLTLLLPRLADTNAVLLNKRQRRVMCDALLLGDADRELDYLLAVVQAVAQGGDEEAVACLRQVVQRGAVTEGQQRVLEAAGERLHHIESQWAHYQHRASLLRASAPSEPATELLRSAQAEVETSPQTLLRPR